VKVTGTAPVTFSETAPALHAQGWRPIPLVADTKRPAEPGWHRFNSEPWSDDELVQALTYHGREACGLAIAPETLALDLDITDPNRAVEVRAVAVEHLGVSPMVRVGLAPKAVLIYRASGLIRSAKPHPIEIYSGSGQIAVFGWHKKAGRPYQWPELSPLDLPVDSPEIPSVRARDVSRFLAAVEPVLRDLRAEARRQRGTGGGIGLDAGEQLRALMRRGFRFRAAARRVLEGATEGGRHFAVRSIVATGFNHGMSAGEIAALIKRHAPADLLDQVMQDGYLERVLSDFQPRQNGWSVEL
jgi:hypothetical protein